jgi:hypothetical protein
MQGTKRLKRNIVYRVRKITNKNILFGGNQTFELNELALLIWNNLNGENTLDDLVNIILEKYEAPKELVEEDVKNFVNEMISCNVILEVE